MYMFPFLFFLYPRLIIACFIFSLDNNLDKSKTKGVFPAPPTVKLPTDKTKRFLNCFVFKKLILNRKKYKEENKK